MLTYFIKSLLPWHKIQTKISGGKQLLILLINIDATKHYHTEPETSKKDYVLWPVGFILGIQLIYTMKTNQCNISC